MNEEKIKRLLTDEEQVAQKLYAGACEKANVCPDANEQCNTPILYTKDMRIIPARRWVDCYAWKRLLGLVFIKDLGVYHLQRCPFCGFNLETELKRNQRQGELK